MKNRRFLNFIFGLLGISGFANVSLPSYFSDNMVLQRNADITLWGWANPSEEITITTGWDNAEYKIIADNQATWRLILKTPHEGGPYTITFKGKKELVLKNVMLGEVWLCSGQSNMEWTAAAGIVNAEAEIAAAD